MIERYISDVDFPRWLKLLGAWRINRESIDFNWGYFAPRMGFEFVLHRGGYFNQHFALSICPGWGQWHVELPFKTTLAEGCDLPQYGVAIHNGAFWIYTGGEYDESLGQCVGRDKWITWDLPYFSYIFDSHEVMNEDGEWVDYIGERKGEDGRHIETHPVEYTLNNGTVQKREASVYRTRRTWHRKWFPFLKMVRVDIDISFNGEVGEQTGSWKGGTVGCSYKELPGETMKETLDRMMKDRKF